MDREEQLPGVDTEAALEENPLELLIRMVRPNLDDLPAISLPEGYRLATAAELDDAPATWADVITRSFGDRQSTAEGFQADYASKVQYDPEGVFFIMHGDEAVSTAFAWRDQPDETEFGRVHWVGTLKEHGRKGLASAVVLAVLHYFKERGFKRGFLETQGSRLPAIRVYMALGFEPGICSEEKRAGEEAVWADVRARLEARG